MRDFVPDEMKPIHVAFDDILHDFLPDTFKLRYNMHYRPVKVDAYRKEINFYMITRAIDLVRQHLPFDEWKKAFTPFKNAEDATISIPFDAYMMFAEHQKEAEKDLTYQKATLAEAEAAWRMIKTERTLECNLMRMRFGNPAKPEFTYRWSKMILPPMSGHVRKYVQEKMDKIISNSDLHTKWLARTIYKVFTHFHPRLNNAEPFTLGLLNYRDIRSYAENHCREKFREDLIRSQAYKKAKIWFFQKLHSSKISCAGVRDDGSLFDLQANIWATTEAEEILRLGAYNKTPIFIKNHNERPTIRRSITNECTSQESKVFFRGTSGAECEAEKEIMKGAEAGANPHGTDEQNISHEHTGYASEAAVIMWYIEEYLPAFANKTAFPSRDDDLKAAKAHFFPKKVIRDYTREARKNHAPTDWKMGKRPKGGKKGG